MFKSWQSIIRFSTSLSSQCVQYWSFYFWSTNIKWKLKKNLFLHNLCKLSLLWPNDFIKYPLRVCVAYSWAASDTSFGVSEKNVWIDWHFIEQNIFWWFQKCPNFNEYLRACFCISNNKQSVSGILAIESCQLHSKRNSGKNWRSVTKKVSQGINFSQRRRKTMSRVLAA